MRVLASPSAVSNARATPRAVRRAPTVLATARSHPDARERTTAMPIAGVVAGAIDRYDVDPELPDPWTR